MTTTPKEIVEPTQEDRDAAAYLAEQIDEPEIAQAIRDGDRDPYVWVQTFARHGLASQAKARSEVIEEAGE
jgi:hypothetical protein